MHAPRQGVRYAAPSLVAFLGGHVPIVPSELKGLIDSNPPASVLVGLAAHYASRRLPATGVDSEGIYESPRAQVMIRTENPA